MSPRAVLFAAVLMATMQPFAAWAVQPDEILPDPVLEGRARALSSELRCMVCQNESIDESSAPLARDLRLLVREHLKSGESDAQVRQYLVARYGDFILLKPPFKKETLLLWGAPLLVLFAGMSAILLTMRRRKGAMSYAASLNMEEQARLSDLLKK